MTSTCSCCKGTGLAPPRMLSITQLVAEHPEIGSRAKVEKEVQRAELIGLSPAVVRRPKTGRTLASVLINEGMYMRWRAEEGG